MRHITTDQIETFLVLAQRRNFRETSEILFITQSTVSKHIKRLEEELGVTLFHRTTQSVVLTEIGQQLAEDWAPLYRSFSDSIDNAIRAASKNKKQLVIGMLRDYRDETAAEVLAGLFSDYLKKRKIPAISLVFHFLSMREQREALRAHQLDFSFALGFDLESVRNVETMILSRQSVKVLLHREHPLANRTSVSLQELAGETFLVLSSSESVDANKVSVLMLQKRLPQAKIITVPNIQTIIYAVRHHQGVTLGNYYFANAVDLVGIPISDMSNAGYEETVNWCNDDMSTNKILFLNFVKENKDKLM